MSRTRWYGRSYERPFHRSTMTSDDAPSPTANRPGAASARPATVCASNAGPRVYTGAMAIPSCSAGVHAAASASGVNPSTPSDSADHASV